MVRPKKVRKELNIRWVRKKKSTVVPRKGIACKPCNVRKSSAKGHITTSLLDEESQTSSVSDLRPSEMKKRSTMKRELLSLQPHVRAKRPKKVVGNKDFLKMKSGNRLVDLDSLVEMIESNTVCKKCGRDVIVDENTVGISTGITLNCKNPNCN